jgi:hypothetical protein
VAKCLFFFPLFNQVINLLCRKPPGNKNKFKNKAKHTNEHEKEWRGYAWYLDFCDHIMEAYICLYSSRCICSVWVNFC